jgi:Mn-dependent DtxR family transcriptional regulator
MRHRQDNRVLLALADSWRTRGVGMTSEELSRQLGVRGNGTVQRAIVRLRARGLIKPGDHYERRGVRLTNDGWAFAGFLPEEERIESLEMCA